MLLNLIPPQIKIGLAVAAVVIIGLMGWRLHAAVQQTGELRASLKYHQQQLADAAMEANEAAKQAKQDVAARDAAAKEARDKAAENAARASELSKQLAEARANADLSACFDMRLPDSVRLP